MEAFNNDDIDMIEYDEDDEEDAPEQYVPHNQIHLIKRSGKNCTLCPRLLCKWSLLINQFKCKMNVSSGLC